MVTLAAPPCFDNVNRYVNCGNGTVTDTVTGLIWLKNAGCFAGFVTFPGEGTLSYPAANQAASALKDGQCGLTDGSSAGNWRLPTKDEWNATIARAVALGCFDVFGNTGHAPAITNDSGTGCLAAGPSSFDGVIKSASVYWSATSVENTPSSAWVAQLDVGYVWDDSKINIDATKINNRTILNSAYVWPVRSR